MAICVQTDMATPALARFGSHELKERYLRPAIAGEMVAAIAVTEPDAGSDVAGLRTRAVRDGDEWVINGTKLYITNGTQADWLCLLARTSDEGGHRGMSQIIVPTDTPGLLGQPQARQARQPVLGHRRAVASSTSGCRSTNTIGEIGRGFQQQMAQFQNERLIAAYIGGRRAALRARPHHRVRDASARRSASTLADKQWIQFKLAELVAEVDLAPPLQLRLRRGRSSAAPTRSPSPRWPRSPSSRPAACTARSPTGACSSTAASATWRRPGRPASSATAALLSIGGGADEVMLRIIAQLEGIGDPI